MALPTTSKSPAMTTATTTTTPPTPHRYSVYTRPQKWLIVILVSYAAWFSTLSSFIYYPALPQLAAFFNVSQGAINLTVTSYMAVAAVAPTLLGDAADVIGRRLVFLAALALYVAANVAMALATRYGVLVGLRVVQALAISGTYSIAYGVIADVAPPAERGSFVSVVSFASTIAPSMGPVLGGGLASAAGWTWIFWFLAIASGSALALVTLFLPETARNIVGNGALEPPKYLRLPFAGFTMRRHHLTTTPQEERERELQQHMEQQQQQQATSNRRRIPNPLKSLAILTRKDNLNVILAAGLLYTVYTCINTALSTLFIDRYGLREWQAGLVYLPFGLGGTASTLFSGRLMDGAYRRARTKQGLVTDRVAGDDLDLFAVERARLGMIWLPMGLSIGSVVSFGWVVQIKTHIAVPLSLQFVAGLCMQLAFSIYNTLVVDKNHRRPSAAQATSNIMRCSLAAIAVAFLQDLIDAVGVGWTFTLMGGLVVLSCGLFYVDYCWGTAWRQAGLARVKEKDNQ